MPKHEVELKIEHEIPIGNKDVEMVVRADGTPLGRVRVSRGGIDWRPSPKSKKCYTMTWQKFADLMAAEGREKA